MPDLDKKRTKAFTCSKCVMKRTQKLRCPHDDDLISDEEQFCSQCNKTFFEIIQALENDNTVMRKMLRDVMDN